MLRWHVAIVWPGLNVVVVWPGSMQQCCTCACALVRFSIPNMSQHVATGWPNALNKRAQQCRHMLCWNVEIVWSERANAGPTMLRYVVLICCDRLAGAFLCTQIHTPRQAWARALSNKIKNDRADDHCHSFAWIWRSWTFGDPYFFFFQKKILFTIISTLSKNEQKINVGS